MIKICILSYLIIFVFQLWNLTYLCILWLSSTIFLLALYCYHIFFPFCPFFLGVSIFFFVFFLFHFFFPCRRYTICSFFLIGNPWTFTTRVYYLMVSKVNVLIPPMNNRNIVDHVNSLEGGLMRLKYGQKQLYPETLLRGTA